MRGGCGRELLACPVWAALIALTSCFHRPPPKTGSLGMRPVEFPMRDFRLPSGLRIVVEQDTRAPIVGVVTLLGVGAAQDPAGKQGLAGLTARLSRRARPGGLSTLGELLERTGAVSAGTTTDFDSTVFYEFARKDALHDLLALEASRLLRPLIDIDEDEFAVARQQALVELTERRQADPRLVILPHLQQALFPAPHPYARPVAGTAAGLSACTLDDARRLTRMYYRADNATLVVIGDLDLSTIVPTLARALPSDLIGDPAHRFDVPVRALAEPPPAPPASGVVEQEADVLTPELWVGWSVPGGYGSGGAVPQLAADLLAARLNEPAERPDRTLLVRQRELARGEARGNVAAGTPRQMAEESAAIGQLAAPVIDRLPLLQNPDVIEATAFTVPGARATLVVCRLKLRGGSRPESLLEPVLDQVRRVWFDPATTMVENIPAGWGQTRNGLVLQRAASVQWLSGPEEVTAAARIERSRVRRLSTLALDAEELMERALLVARRVHFAAEPRAYSREVEALLAVAPAALERFVYQHLGRERARVVVVRPAQPRPDAALPLTARLEPHAPGLVMHYDPEAVLALARAPQVGDLRSRKLENGLEVVIARRTGMPVVTVALGLLGGRIAAEPPGVLEVAERVSEPRHDHGDLDLIGARERRSFKDDLVTYELQAGAGNLDQVVAMAADRALRTDVVPERMSEFRTHLLPVLTLERERPRARAERAFWRALYGPTARRLEATGEEIGRVEARDVVAWLRDAHSPRRAVLAIVGEIDPAQAEASARKWLGGWQPATREGEVRVIFEDKSQLVEEGAAPPARAPQVLTTEAPGSALAGLRFGCLLPRADERRQVVYQLSAELLGAHLRRELEGRMGASTRIESHADEVRPVGASMVVSAELAGAALADAVQALRAALTRLADADVDDDELNGARWTLAHRYTLRFASTRDLALGALQMRRQGLSLDALARYPQTLASVSKREVVDAFRVCRDAQVLSLVGDGEVVRKAVAAVSPGRP